MALALGRRGGGDGAAGSRGDRRPGRRHRGDVDRAAVGVFAGAAVGAGRVPSMDPDDPASAYRSAGSGMSMQTHLVASARSVRRALVAGAGRRVAATRRPRRTEKAAPAGAADDRGGQGRRAAARRDVVVAGRVDSLPDRRAVFASDWIREDDQRGSRFARARGRADRRRSKRPNSSRRRPRRSRSCRAREAQLGGHPRRRPRRTRARTTS